MLRELSCHTIIAADTETEGLYGERLFEQALTLARGLPVLEAKVRALQESYARCYKGKKTIKGLQWRTDTYIKFHKGAPKVYQRSLTSNVKNYIDSIEARLKKANHIIDDLNNQAIRHPGGLNFWENSLAMIQLGIRYGNVYKCFLIRFSKVSRRFFKEIEDLLNSRDTILLHHAQFDWKMLKKHADMELHCCNLFDTKIAEYVLKNGLERRTGMGAVAKRRLGIDLDKDKSLRVNHWLGPWSDRMQEYAALDVVMPFLIYDQQLLELSDIDKDVLHRECKLSAETARMEMQGLGIDIEQARKLLAEAICSRNQALELCGRLLSIDSTEDKTMGILRVDVMQETIKSVLDSKPKLKNQLSLCGFELEDLKESTLLKLKENNHDASDIVESIINYRLVDTLISRYLEPFIRRSIPVSSNGIIHYRIYGELKQSDTETGRYASENPNLQNLPKTKAFRSLIIASPGHVLIQGDLASIEPRILAEMSQEPVLIKAFELGLDPYKYIGKYLLRKSYEDVTKDERGKIKAVVLGLCYGKTAAGLAKDLGTSVREAAALINQIFNNILHVKRWKLNTIERAYVDGYVRTLGGRTRYLPDLQSEENWIKKHAENQAINTPIQGTAADMMKESIYMIGEMLKLRIYQNHRLIVTVHDELLIECPDNVVDIQRGKDLLKYGLIEGSRKFVKCVPIEIGSEPLFEPSVLKTWGDEIVS